MTVNMTTYVGKGAQNSYGRNQIRMINNNKRLVKC